MDLQQKLNDAEAMHTATGVNQIAEDIRSYQERAYFPIARSQTVKPMTQLEQINALREQIEGLNQTLALAMAGKIGEAVRIRQQAEFQLGEMSRDLDHARSAIKTAHEREARLVLEISHRNERVNALTCEVSELHSLLNTRLSYIKELESELRSAKRELRRNAKATKTAPEPKPRGRRAKK